MRGIPFQAHVFHAHQHEARDCARGEQRTAHGGGVAEQGPEVRGVCHGSKVGMLEESRQPQKGRDVSEHARKQSAGNAYAVSHRVARRGQPCEALLQQSRFGGRAEHQRKSDEEKQVLDIHILQCQRQALAHHLVAA